jgi:hypothetical protein
MFLLQKCKFKTLVASSFCPFEIFNLAYSHKLDTLLQIPIVFQHNILLEFISIYLAAVSLYKSKTFLYHILIPLINTSILDYLKFRAATLSIFKEVLSQEQFSEVQVLFPSSFSS